MTITEALTQNISSLTEKEKLEILNQQWLLDHAPPDSQANAVSRIHALLQSNSDAGVVMKAIREVNKDLQRAIEESIARLQVLGTCEVVLDQVSSNQGDCRTPLHTSTRRSLWVGLVRTVTRS